MDRKTPDDHATLIEKKDLGKYLDSLEQVGDKAQRLRLHCGHAFPRLLLESRFSQKGCDEETTCATCDTPIFKRSSVTPFRWYDFPVQLDQDMTRDTFVQSLLRADPALLRKEIEIATFVSVNWAVTGIIARAEPPAQVTGRSKISSFCHVAIYSVYIAWKIASPSKG